MTMLSSFIPMDGDSKPQDANKSRFDSSSVFQAGDYLEQQAENLERGIPVDQHEADIRKLEAIASGGEVEPDEVQTMTVEPKTLAGPGDPQYEEI